MRIDKVDSKVTKLWDRSEEKKKQDLMNHNKAQKEFALLDANDNK